MSDGLRNELKITVDSTGATGGPGGAGYDLVSRPISRRGQLEMSPFQGMSNYSSNRQLQFSNEIAMEIARDQRASREINEALMRHEARNRLDLSSARRDAKEKVQRNLMEAIGASHVADGSMNQAFTRRMVPRELRGLSRLGGVARGGMYGALASTILPQGGGAAGAVLRVAGETAAAGLGGGGPWGMGLQALWTTMRELRAWQTADAKQAENTRLQLAAIKEKGEKELAAVRESIEQVRRVAREEFESIVFQATKQLRTEAFRHDRYISFDLVP